MNYLLIVEDDPSSAKLLTVLLRGDGFETRTVPCAEDALIVIKQVRPSLILLDLDLPGMSGLQFAHHLHEHVAPHIPIITVTASNSPRSERTARLAMCVAHVRKPIDPVPFILLVRSQQTGVQA